MTEGRGEEQLSTRVISSTRINRSLFEKCHEKWNERASETLKLFQLCRKFVVEKFREIDSPWEKKPKGSL